MVAVKARAHIVRSKLSFSDGVKHELHEVFRLHPDIKGRYSHLKTLGQILKTRMIGTRRRKPRQAK